MTDKKEDCEELLKELKAYRNDMVARNYPFQQINDIIIKWEIKKVKTVSEKLQDELEPIKDFLDEAEREKKELEERKSKEWTKGYDKWKKDK